MQLLNSSALWLVGQTRIDPLSLVVDTNDRPAQSSAGIGLTLTLVTIAIGAAVVAFLRNVSPRTVDDGKLLFSELCHSNHLTRRQRKLLLEMARLKKVDCASQLLMDISLWTPDPNQPARWEQPKVQIELHRLRSLLFTQGKFTEESEPVTLAN